MLRLPPSLQRTVGYILTDYGPLVFGKRPVRTRTLGGVGREKLGFISLNFYCLLTRKGSDVFVRPTSSAGPKVQPRSTLLSLG